MDQPMIRTRAALSEIPLRMGLMRVSTEEIDPTTPTVLNPTVIDNPFNNIPINYLTPSPSPDELVIRQRGRRRIPLTWSPEKTPTTLASTPTKSNNPTTTMTLRSSPRKRLLLNEYTPTTPEKLIPTINNLSNTSPRNLSSPSSKFWYPNSKRLRSDNKPIIGQTQSTVPLPTLLKGLNQDQLLNIIQNLIQEKPELEEKIRKELPMPDLKPMEDQLNNAKKNIFKSLPTSRLVRKTNNAGYSRASTHLATFKKLVIDQCNQLYMSRHWDALLEYAQIAWSYVKSTPVWDNQAHNGMRKHCFKILAWNCLAALKYGGVALGESRLTEFGYRMNQMAIDCDDVLSCKEILYQALGSFTDITSNNFM